MPRPTVSALLAAISDEFRKGRIYEAPIHGSDDHVEGLCNWESGEITVNPSPNVVDTLFHELLHRRYPKWSEDRVRFETWRIMQTLDHKAVAIWYRKYKRSAKPKKLVKLRSAELQG